MTGMAKFIGHQQGSPEWHSWRDGGLGGSDAPIIMGVSPWTTPYQLWQEKTGRAKQKRNTFAMNRGKRLEGKARDAYESLTGNVVMPVCLQHGVHSFQRASTDGLTFDQDIVVEIKCPGKEDHQKALDGEVPEKYVPQCQHLMMVTGASVCHYYSFDGKEGVLIKVPRDNKYIRQLSKAEEKFWELVKTDKAPELTDRDYATRKDEAWIHASEEYKQAKEALELAKEKVDAAGETLKALANGKPSVGGGVRLVSYYRAGNVQYKKIPELKKVDLDQYRGKGQTIMSIRLTDD